MAVFLDEGACPLLMSRFRVLQLNMQFGQMWNDIYPDRAPIRLDATLAEIRIATVVLLTPVVFATAARVGVRPRPHVYACTHIANGGSLLLPVSNLTNLLAMSALGIGFAQFGLVMLLPWLAVLVVEYLAFRWYFARDLKLSAGAGETGANWVRYSSE